MENDGYMGGDDWGGGDEEYERTKRNLDSLTSSFYTSFVLNNDSAVGLRMNLTTGWKYTICVDLQPLNGSEERPIADVYLLQEDDYSKYEFDFDSRNDEWEGMRDDMAHSAPWLQNLILWQSMPHLFPLLSLHQSFLHSSSQQTNPGAVEFL